MLTTTHYILTSEEVERLVADVSSDQYKDYIKQLSIRTLHRPSIDPSTSFLFLSAELSQKINCIKFFTDTKSTCKNDIYSLEIHNNSHILFGFNCPPYIQNCWLEFNENDKIVKMPINNKQDKNGYVHFNVPLILPFLRNYKITLYYTYYPWFKMDGWTPITLIFGITNIKIKPTGRVELSVINALFSEIKPTERYAIMGPDNNYIFTDSIDNIEKCFFCKKGKNTIYQLKNDIYEKLLSPCRCLEDGFSH